MTNIRFKAIITALSIFICLLSLNACKAKKITINRDKLIETSNVKVESVNEQSNTVKSVIDENKAQEEIFQELISSLQLKFNGQNDNDRLQFELQKTIDGLKFQISGTGTANYEQTEKANLERLLFKYNKSQDSLFNQRLNTFQNEFKQQLKEHYSKEKEVKILGLQPGMYLILGIALVLIILLYWISKQFNFKKPL